MRLLVLIGIVAATSSMNAAGIPERITINQLEQILATRPAESQARRQQTYSPEEIPYISDVDLLHEDQSDELLSRITTIELTERLSTLTMFRLIGKYRLAPNVQLALEQLADRSALMNLPSSEQLNSPAPDIETQQEMVDAARAYVGHELSRLPNFMATRTTTRFDDASPLLKYWKEMSDRAGFHRVGSVQRQVTFRDGEVIDGDGGGSDPKQRDSGLESQGEFGAEAAVVLMDMQQGTVTFDHWEQSMLGPAAVYQYSVPHAASHYQVNNTCQEHVSFHDSPAYHGSIALAPKTGAILRMTLEAESRQGDPLTHVASVIEYGPVVLGNHRSICPLKSLVFMVEEVNGCSHGSHKLQKPVTMINQTVFSNYHRFGSSSTMIFDASASGHSAPGEREKPDTRGGKRNPLNPPISGQTMQH